MSRSRIELVGTSDLMAWFGVNKWAVRRAMRAAGVEAAGRGAHGQAMWPRVSALLAMTVATRRKAADVVTDDSAEAGLLL